MKTGTTRQALKNLRALQGLVKYSRLNPARIQKDYIDAESDYTYMSSREFYKLSPEEADFDTELRTIILKERDEFAYWFWSVPYVT